MKKNKLPIFFIITGIILSACSKEISYKTYDDFTLSLANAGFTIEEESLENDFLSGERKQLKIDQGEMISVYIYESDHAMEQDASYISRDGFTYDKGGVATSISWVSYPYFFKKEDIIILYVGENEKIIDTLEEIAGPQFAGQV